MYKKLIALGLVVSLCIVSLILIIYRPAKIGIILSNETTMGYEENLAIKYYQSRYPRAGKYPLRFYIETPAALEEDLYREAYYKLKDQGVSIILSGELSQTAMFVAPLAEETGIPTFGITSSSHELSGKADNFYRIVTPTDDIGSYMGEYVSSLDFKKVAMITSVENAIYADAFASSFTQTFSGITRHIPFNNYQRVMDEIELFNPEAVFCVLPVTTLMQIIKGIRKEYGDKEIFSSDWGFMQLISVFSGPQLNGITALYHSGEIPEQYRDIIREFEELYSIESTYSSHNTISILNMILNAIREVGPDSAKIIKYFNEPRYYDSLMGSLYMDEYGDSNLQYHYVYQIMDDKLELRRKIEDREYRRHLEK